MDQGSSLYHHTRRIQLRMNKDSSFLLGKVQELATENGILLHDSTTAGAYLRRSVDLLEARKFEAFIGLLYGLDCAKDLISKVTHESGDYSQTQNIIKFLTQLLALRRQLHATLVSDTVAQKEYEISPILVTTLTSVQRAMNELLGPYNDRQFIGNNKPYPIIQT